MRNNFENLIPCINPNVEIVKTKDMGIICIQKEYDYRVTLNQHAFDVICLIDGKKTIGQLTKEFNDKKGEDISANMLLGLLDGVLKKSGIINMGDGYRINHSEPSYLRLRINLIGNRHSSLISRYLKYLFGRRLFWTLFVVQSLIVYSIFILYAKDMYFQLENIRLADTVVVFVLMGIALVAHEFGHVSACDRYGAHHGSIGFGFYLFTPVMYADVSDIWRLPQNQRIIVNMAGIYMGNYIAVIAFAIYLYTGNLIFLYVFSLQCIESLCNLNPLLKYDGYWMLSDLLKLPNMSMMAYKKIKTFSFRLLAIYNAKDWFLLVYGVISPIFIVFFLATVLILNPDSVLYFPKDFIMYIYGTILDVRTFSFLKLANFAPYILFYYLVIKICKRCFSKIRSKCSLLSVYSIIHFSTHRH